MPDSSVAYVALGSNLGDPEGQVERGFTGLAALPGTRLAARSRLYRTLPWGIPDQPAFVNAAAALETALSPRELLAALLAIESRAGRLRGVRNGPRTLDLDLLSYGDCTLDEEGLTIPHPRLHQRAFVLLPLADIAPDLEIRGRGRVRELLARVDTTGCLPIG